MRTLVYKRKKLPVSPRKPGGTNVIKKVLKEKTGGNLVNMLKKPSKQNLRSMFSAPKKSRKLRK